MPKMMILILHVVLHQLSNQKFLLQNAQLIWLCKGIWKYSVFLFRFNEDLNYFSVFNLALAGFLRTT